MSSFAAFADTASRPLRDTIADLIAPQMTPFVRAGAVHELRALRVTLPGQTPRTSVSGYFDNVGDLARAAAVLDGHCKGIYFTLNPLNPRLLERATNRMDPNAAAATNADVTNRRWIPLDFDPCRPTGTNSTDTQLSAAIARADQVWLFLRNEGWPEPFAAVSGNGAHLLYPTDQPTDDRDIVKNAVHRLAEMFSDDVVTIDKAVHNAARIWKVYGTLACKGEPGPGRPYRRACVLRKPLWAA